MNKYHVKGKIKISVTQIIEIEVDEIVERKYLVDAKYDIEGKYIEQIGALYPEALVDVYSAAGLGIKKVDDVEIP